MMLNGKIETTVLRGRLPGVSLVWKGMALTDGEYQQLADTMERCFAIHVAEILEKRETTFTQMHLFITEK